MAVYSTDEACVANDTEDLEAGAVCGKAVVQIDNHSLKDFVVIPRLSRQAGGVCSAATGFTPLVSTSGSRSTLAVPTLKATAVAGGTPAAFNASGYPLVAGSRLAHVTLTFVMVTSGDDLTSGLAAAFASDSVGQYLDGKVAWDTMGAMTYTINTCNGSGSNNHVSGDGNRISMPEHDFGIASAVHVHDDRATNIDIDIQPNVIGSAACVGQPHHVVEAQAGRTWRVISVGLMALLVVTAVALYWHATHDSRYLHPRHLEAHMHDQRLRQLAAHEDVFRHSKGQRPGVTAKHVNAIDAHRFSTYE